MADVLLAEDHKVLRETLKRLLEDEGYAVYVSQDGQAALDILRNHPTPMVALLDWHMPGLDGIQALHIIAKDTSLARRHMFILTSAAVIDARTLPSSLDVHVLYKPYALDDLLSLVSTVATDIA